MIFQQESNDINKSKNLCCFQVDDNKYEVKLRVKLAVERFIELLKMKEQEQQKKKKDLQLDLHPRFLIIQYLSIKHNHEFQYFHHYQRC